MKAVWASLAKEESSTGMLPLTAVLSLSVTLWPAWLPAESPMEVSGMVLSVEAIMEQYTLIAELEVCF